MMMIVVMMIIRLAQQHFPDLEISVMFQQILEACRFLTYLVWIPKQFITRTNPSWTVKTFHARPNFHLSGGWLVSMSNLPDHFLQGSFNSSIDDIFTEWNQWIWFQLPVFWSKFPSYSNVVLHFQHSIVGDIWLIWLTWLLLRVELPEIWSDWNSSEYIFNKPRVASKLLNDPRNEFGW